MHFFIINTPIKTFLSINHSDFCKNPAVRIIRVNRKRGAKYSALKIAIYRDKNISKELELQRNLFYLNRFVCVGIGEIEANDQSLVRVVRLFAHSSYTVSKRIFGTFVRVRTCVLEDD